VLVSQRGVPSGCAHLAAPLRGPWPRRPPPGPSVLRMVDGSGSVNFAGWAYRVGRFQAPPGRVAIVENRVQLSVDGKVIKTHPIRHDRTKEHGAFATPKGRLHKKGPPREVFTDARARPATSVGAGRAMVQQQGQSGVDGQPGPHGHSLQSQSSTAVTSSQSSQQPGRFKDASSCSASMSCGSARS
jgi:hypothetical protein